jgi:hypothetical protein
MPLYRKRPVVIEARQTGQDYDEDCSIMKWCSGRFPLEGAGFGNALFIIDTSANPRYVMPGDWVIKEVDGNFTNCNPVAFKYMYEPVSYD